MSREFRAALLFVLLSLFGGAAFRAWTGSRGPTLTERLRALEEEARLDAEREGDAGVGALTTGRAASSGVASSAGGRGARGAARDMEELPPLGLLDPDRATISDWERLPGIGPALAARIVADRSAHGPFRNADALRRVKGIGPRTVERLRPYLRPLPPPADSASPNAN